MISKLPPPEKILEAWSALGCDRLKLLSPANAVAGDAEMRSSDGAKTYSLSWNGEVYRSSDSATVWQGYPGYPVLALLMLKGMLPYPRELARILAPINWTSLNKQARGNYALSAQEAFRQLDLDQALKEKIMEEMNATYSLLPELPIKVQRFRKATKSETS